MIVQHRPPTNTPRQPGGPGRYPAGDDHAAKPRRGPSGRAQHRRSTCDCQFRLFRTNALNWIPELYILIKNTQGGDHANWRRASFRQPQACRDAAGSDASSVIGVAVQTASSPSMVSSSRLPRGVHSLSTSSRRNRHYPANKARIQPNGREGGGSKTGRGFFRATAVPHALPAPRPSAAGSFRFRAGDCYLQSPQQ